jgi:cytochrome c-type biogenesis protein CcmH
MKRFMVAVVLAFSSLSGAAYAVDPGERLDDPALEERARDLSQELRCLVCQNQSIDGSDAPLARDLRILVRERLTAGDSNDEVMAFIVARYGDFVLLRPRFHIETWLLWLSPFVVLIAGAVGVFVILRGRQAPSQAVEPLTTAEKARLEEIVNKSEPE